MDDIIVATPIGLLDEVGEAVDKVVEVAEGVILLPELANSVQTNADNVTRLWIAVAALAVGLVVVAFKAFRK